MIPSRAALVMPWRIIAGPECLPARDYTPHRCMDKAWFPAWPWISLPAMAIPPAGHAPIRRYAGPPREPGTASRPGISTPPHVSQRAAPFELMILPMLCRSRASAGGDEATTRSENPLARNSFERVSLATERRAEISETKNESDIQVGGIHFSPMMSRIHKVVIRHKFPHRLYAFLGLFDLKKMRRIGQEIIVNRRDMTQVES